ncbi:MAG: CxxxxCH/CxxCH domain-containing protein [Ignavibacteria bacterium]|nr:CxxxxCH/CxxCH domain-containing protein [Ignavibacteria bacterium]
MKYLILYLTIFLSSVLFLSCTDLKEDITTSAPELALHKDGIINPASPNFHGKIISSNNWDMKQCQQCHASNYSGGTAQESCYKCHTLPGGPEACNTCHGEFADPLKSAPPRSLNGSIVTTTPGVGAHTLHLYENNLGKEILCTTCHKVPSAYGSADHLGTDGKAELTFGELSIQGGATPIYSFSSNTCSDTYCHGNFVFYKDSSAYSFVYTAATMTGNNATVKWNQVDGTQAECGSCHGLPPVGHMASALTGCVNCHQGVVNAQGEIIDPTKHMNGVKNAFGN